MASNAECKKFIAEVAPIIQKIAKERGYLICSTVIAQACIESAYGLSGLAKYNNLFGMKCGNTWKGTSVNMKTKEEYTVGHLTTIRDNFRTYPDLVSGINGYYDFISTKRYANLKTADTPLLYAERLKQDGYATSSTYVNTLMTTCNKWGLQKWDDFNYHGESYNEPIVVDTKPQSNGVIKYHKGTTYKTNVNLFIRVEPEGNKTLISQITKNAKQNSYDDGNGYAILRKGTKVTCQGTVDFNGNIWMKIPSGWIAATYRNKEYVNEV